ncbi:DUF732 domain-containing protein [Mycobacterium sp.]|uniref:DUF732 domain-containing protein n=1 Tax=Mycobacterium sp. TaxID=1785 RepID=UPI003BAF4924
MSTQTQAAAPDAGEPTVVVDDDKAAALAGLAWSEADDDETFSFDQHDRTTFWLRLYVGTVAVVVVVLGVTLWSVLSQRSEPEPAAAHRVPVSSTAVVTPVPSEPDDKVVPSTTESAPPPVITEPPPVTTEAPPPVTTSTPVQGDPQARDAAFIRSLQAHGMNFASEAAAIEAAGGVCANLGQGYSESNVAAALRNANPGLTFRSAYEFLGLSTTFYCPQFNGGHE